MDDGPWYSANESRQITSMKDLRENLYPMCRAIHKSLGTRNLEATYQGALALDLAEAGVRVEREVEIDLCYKGSKIGTRRADLLLTVGSGMKWERAVVELKAISGKLDDDHVRQLKYYMTHFEVEHGFLINFKHVNQFPGVQRSFQVERWVSEDSGGSISSLEGKLAAMHVSKPEEEEFRGGEEGHVDMIVLTDLGPAGVKDNTQPVSASCMSPQRKAAPAPAPTSYTTTAAPATLPVRSIWGYTKAGKPCKICQGKRDFCRLHLNQRCDDDNEDCTSDL